MKMGGYGWGNHVRRRRRWRISIQWSDERCMVNEIIGELMDLDMEPTLESLEWTSTYTAGDGKN